jgi:hypothetical protein
MRVYTRTEGGVRFEELTYVNSLRNGVFKVWLFILCDFPFPAERAFSKMPTDYE